MRKNKYVVRCFAKINTLLKVLSSRKDGYHNIHTHFQSIDLHDILQVEIGGSEIKLTCEGAELPLDESNLVIKAVKIFRNNGALSSGLNIHLVKKIPVSAGLGGGSSDAAAMLRVLNMISHNHFNQNDLTSMAAEIGSDVPYFLLGGHALGTGRGENLRPLPDPETMTLLLLIPEIKISASEAYQYFDLTFEGKISDINNQDHSPFAVDFAANKWQNDLEKGVFANYPELETISQLLVSKGAKEVLMSGSGASIVGWFSDYNSAKEISNELDNGNFDIILSKSITAEQYGRLFLINGDEPV